MARKILIALCVLFVMPVFVISGCDEVQENLSPKSSFIADFSCEYRKMNITGKLSVSGKKLINISLDSPNTVSGVHSRKQFPEYYKRNFIRNCRRKGGF